MSNTRKNKSRTHLYNAIAGAVEHAGRSGESATWTVTFSDVAVAGEVVQVGPYFFQYVADGSEDTAGDSVGSAADPHLITIGGTPTATTAANELVTAMLAETETTGAWGFLHPDDSVGASNSTGTATINFWPGTTANVAGYITTDAANGVAAKTNDGNGSLPISTAHSVTIIDTTGGTENKEYYTLEDGSQVGQVVRVLVKTYDTGDTPAIMGKLEDTDGTDHIAAVYTTAEPGGFTDWMWLGDRWRLIEESATITALSWETK